MAPTAEITRDNLLLRTLAPEAFEAFEVREEEHEIAVVLIEADETPGRSTTRSSSGMSWNADAHAPTHGLRP
jgi:hypothetical protein